MSQIVNSDYLDLAIQKHLENEDLSTYKGYKEPYVADSSNAFVPDHLRVQFEIFKGANLLPPEVELMKKREKLRLEIEDQTLNDQQKKQLKVKLSTLNAEISMRLENIVNS